MTLFPLTLAPSSHFIAANSAAEERRIRLEYLKRHLDADLVVEMNPLVLRLMSDGAELTIEGKRYVYLGAVGEEAVLRAVDREAPPPLGRAP
jgi:hypothetical protein